MRALTLYDKSRAEHPLNGVTTAGVFVGLILAFSAFVISGVATVYLIFLLASSDVPGTAKIRSAILVGLAWAIAWAAWALLTRG